MVSEEQVKAVRKGMILNNKKNKINKHLAKVLMEESLLSEEIMAEMPDEKDVNDLLQLTYNFGRLKAQVALTDAMIDFATWMIAGGDYGEDFSEEEDDREHPE